LKLITAREVAEPSEYAAELTHPLDQISVVANTLQIDIRDAACIAQS
jgi:hypothetical protein